MSESSEADKPVKLIIFGNMH